MDKYQSNAQWPLDVYRGMDGNGISTDTHRTKADAQAVCDILRREGFGGERKNFPTAATTGEVVRPLLLVALAYAAGRAHDPKEDE